MKKYTFIFLLLVVISLLAGCGYKDIDNRFFVVTMGIDKPENEEKKYKVHLKLAIPSAEIQVGESEYIIESEESNSISEAVRIIKARSDREIDFAHMKVFLIGEEMVKQPIQENLDWLLRRRDIQKISWIGIGKPSALEVMKITPEIERIPSNSLFLTLSLKGSETPYTIPKYLFEFHREMKTEGQSAVLPIIEKREEKMFQVQTATVFDQEKGVLTLNAEQTKLFNEIDTGFEKVDIRVEEEGEDFFILAAEVFKGTYAIHDEKGKKPYIDFKVDVEGIIEESSMQIQNEKLKEYGKKAEKQLKEEIEQFLIKLRDLNLDPFGFGLQYRATRFNNKTELERWNEIYPEIDFNVITNVKVKGTGVIE
ncbi:Ger(x)C family spore germination protein [Cytobacillus sp. FJAT-54145]|uniref:Ger(X)C family spore germination protein n=1 Tax=Cytobacillus spartinae TaxID=3299023 RepID=A0ABW6K8I3_9BACI